VKQFRMIHQRSALYLAWPASVEQCCSDSKFEHNQYI